MFVWKKKLFFRKSKTTLYCNSCYYGFLRFSNFFYKNSIILYLHYATNKNSRNWSSSVHPLSQAAASDCRWLENKIKKSIKTKASMNPNLFEELTRRVATHFYYAATFSRYFPVVERSHPDRYLYGWHFCSAVTIR